MSLRLKANEGDSDTYRYEQRIDLKMPPEFGGSHKLASLLVLEQTAQRVVGDTIFFGSEVKDVSVEAGDSSLNAGLDFSRFKGQHFTTKITREARVLEIRMADSTIAGVEAIQQSLRQLGFPTLPDHPVRIGDSWSDTTRVDASTMALPAQGVIVSVNHATLSDLSTRKGTTVADLAVETSFTFQPSGQAFPGLSVDMTGSRADHVRFDVTHGRFLTGTGRQSFTMSMAIPGAAGSMSIEGKATSTAKRIDS
ncbi:MAG: hypothetical protein ACE5HQ_09260 [Gemmatimonadota bacterium]